MIAFVLKIALLLLAFLSSSFAKAVTAELKRIQSKKGSHSNQKLSTLAAKDQSGKANDWQKYIEFSPSSGRRGKYDGMFYYQLPNGVLESSVQSIKVDINFLGLNKKKQTWVWYIYNYDRRRWIKLGDNSGAPSWKWRRFNLSVSDTPAESATYINDQGSLRLRYKTNTNKDVSDLDLLRIELEVEDTKPPPPGNIWQPEPGTSWQWQLDSGNIDTSFDVEMYDIDLFDVKQRVINELHDAGHTVICYFSAGSFENWRPDKNDFPAALKGKPLDGWEGERWLDIRNINNSPLAPIMKARLDLAVAKKCDGVEPDNIDGYTNDSGFGLTSRDQLQYNRWLANEAHKRGLSIGLKNDLDQVEALVDDFDWALNEQCYQYKECEALLPFIEAGKAVFGVEYKGRSKKICPKLNKMQFSWLFKNLGLDAERIDCHDYPSS